jgi:hypothetical protein
MIFENRLAPNNRLTKVMLPGLLLFVLTLIVFQTSDRINSWTLILVTASVYLVLITLIIKGYRSHDIYYDRINMYLKGGKGVLTVPYNNVKKIRMALSNITILGLKFYHYKIDYCDHDGRLCEIGFWTPIISKEVDQFGEQVRDVNGNIKIEHWAASG